MQFEVEGQTYQIGSMNTIIQHHVARKLSSALIPLANLRKAADNPPGDEEMARAFCSMCVAVSNEDMDYAMSAVLGCVSRSMGQDRGWGVLLAPNGALMYGDISLTALNLIIVKVLDHFRLIDFFVERPSGSPDPKRTEKTG